MEKVSWSSEAESNLSEIGDYIAVDNPDAAWRTVCEIVDHISLLENFPHLGTPYRVENGKQIYETPSGKYRIFYIIRKPDNEVFIIKIWHGARQEPDFTDI